ncbi:unnamed protein product [marine sediment metagenome]|uniref:Uncharacterized protein n=1 Tax=marine sediment metagenome TaxID=412755 RepID=X1SU44_9ZZZZ
MIDFILAKELKDAGFPQHQHLDSSEPSRGSWFHRHDSVDIWEWKLTSPSLSSVYVYVPTLSELIAWCEPFFLALYTKERDGEVKVWAAESIGIALGIKEEFLGKTPEEAVARLGIDLHTKSKVEINKNER